MRWLVSLILIFTFTLSAFGEDVEAKDFEYLTHFFMGVGWDMSDGDNHSIAACSIVTWKKIFNFDVGLIDFEQVETDGELWWQDLNPAVGVSADLIELARLMPQIESIISWLPNWVGVGAGLYTELSDFDNDVEGIVYATLNWTW